MSITIPTQFGPAEIESVAVYPVDFTASGQCIRTSPEHARFFTLYGTDTDGHELAIHDYKHQQEAELAACIFTSLLKLQEGTK